jgi:purine-nucleoside/S-methyl-5'-thioadenosine phosphorylase / adenosine deaminase
MISGMIDLLSSPGLNGLKIYQFPLFKNFAGITHGIITRHGGTRQGDPPGLNLSFSVGDEPARVAEHRGLIKDLYGLKGLFSLRQVHGKETVIINGVPDSTYHQSPESFEGDILMTDRPGQGLMIKQADCQAVLLYDPEHQAIANIHCGWRGNVNGVLIEAVRKMQKTYGSNPSRLLAGISPSLGPCCAEFIHYRDEIPARYWSYQVKPTYFDLWQISRDQLLEAGLEEDLIEIAGLCTSCRTENFYSYRKERNTGRFGTLIALA